MPAHQYRICSLNHESLIMGLDPSKSQCSWTEQAFFSQHWKYLISNWLLSSKEAAVPQASGFCAVKWKTWTLELLLHLIKVEKTVKRLQWTNTSIPCQVLVDPRDLPYQRAVSSVADHWPAGTVHGSTVGMVLTLLFRLILRSGLGRGSLVWISSSGVLPSGGSSLFLLFLVSGNHWGGSSKGPKPNCVESSASVGVAGATWDEEA